MSPSAELNLASIVGQLIQSIKEPPCSYNVSNDTGSFQNVKIEDKSCQVLYNELLVVVLIQSVLITSHCENCEGTKTDYTTMTVFRNPFSVQKFATLHKCVIIINSHKM